MMSSAESSSKPFCHLYFKDLLPYADKKEVTEKFVTDVAKKLVQFLAISNDRNSKIINFVTPEEIKACFNFTLPEYGTSLGGILEQVENILHYVVKTAHPRFYNQLWAGVDVNCLMGQWIANTTNTSMYTYEMAPLYVMMEKTILNKLQEYVGYENGDGLLFPGGSISNIQAMNLARYKYCPDLKKTGLFAAKKLISYVSEEGHYSISKAAALIGVGMDNVVKVKTETRGKIIVKDLEDKIKETIARNEQPFFVCATGGTTVGGAYDPLDEIADVCEKYKIWMHIDAAWGGSCLISKKHKHLMKGCHRADSITWNPHKLMNCLLQCSVLLTKENGLLKQCNSTGATYLFQQDKKLYDVAWDTGDKTFQCGRSNDVLRLWLMWKAKGTAGMEEHVDLAFSNARYLADQVKARSNFELLREPECANVCFRYIPPGISILADGPEKLEKLAKVPPEIKKRMTHEGTLMIGYQPLKDHGNFFRMITSNSAANPADMDFILNEIERLGKDL